MAYMKDKSGRRLDTFNVAPKLANMAVAPGMVPVSQDLLFPQARLTGSASYDSWMWIPTTHAVGAVQFLMGAVDTSDAVTLNGGARPTDGWALNDVRYAMSVQTVGGRITQIRQGGALLFTVKAGTTVLTDLQDVDIPEADGGFYVRLYSERDTGTNFGIPAGRILTGQPTSGQVSTGGTNNTALAGPIAAGGVTGGGSSPSPLAVFAHVPGGAPVVVGVVGDSIAAGTSDTPSASRGFLTLALQTAGLPFIKVARGSERALEFGGTQSIGRIRQSLIAGCTHVIHEYFINDATSIGAEPTKAALLASWKKQARRGAKVYQTTGTPKSTSTDDWKTTTSQGAQNSTDIVAVNSWIRDGAPLVGGVPAAVGASGALRAGAEGHPLAGWVEVAAAVESATNSGLWKAAPVTGVANTTTGTKDLTGVTGSWAVGDRIVGAGIPVDSWVTHVNPAGAGTLTIRNNATATATGVAVHSPMTNDGTHPASRGVQAMATAPALVALLNSWKAA
jgi:hypothetical protein